MIITNKIILIGSFIFSLAFIIAWPYSPLMIVAAVLLIGIFYIQSEYLFTFSIVLFLVITRSEFSNLRVVANISAIILLLISYMKMRMKDNLQTKWVPTKITALIAFMLLGIILSILYNHIPGNSFLALLRTIFFFIILFILYQLIKDKKTLLAVILAIISAHFIISISVFYEFMMSGFNFFSPKGLLERFTGIMDNPNFVGLTAIISTSFLVMLLFIERLKKYRTIWIALLLINFIVILLTDSRSAVISILLGVIFILYHLNRKVLVYTLVSGISIILILLIIPSVQDMLMIMLRPSEISARNYFWDSGIEMFKDHPIFGVGAERFPEYFFTYLSAYANTMFTQTGAFDPGKIPSPHNYFLLMACENGIFGILSSALIFAAFFYYSIRNIIYTKKLDNELYIISVALTAIGIGVFFRAFFEVSGIMSYGYILQDLPFWLLFLSILQIDRMRMSIL